MLFKTTADTVGGYFEVAFSPGVSALQVKLQTELDQIVSK